MGNLKEAYFEYWDLFGKGQPQLLFYENDFINNLYTCFLIIFSFLLIKIFVRKEKLIRAYFFYSYHLIFTALFILYTAINVNDSDTFFKYSHYPYYYVDGIKVFRIGTNSLVNIISFFNNFLNLSYINWNIIFGFIGFVGIFLLDTSIQKLILNRSKIIKFFFSLLILLPSLHFFSSGVGKETLSILSVGLLIYAIKFNNKYLIVVSFLIMFFTRVHIFILMLFTYSINLFFKSELSIKLKVLTSFISFVIFLLLSTKIIVGEYLSLELLDAFFAYSEKQRGYLIAFRTWYDTVNFSLIQTISYFLFYPLIFSKFSNYTDLVIIIENYIYLVFFLTLIVKLFLERKNLLRIKDLTFYLMFTAGVIFLLSHFISVYGIILRQKWIYIPFLIVFLAELVSTKHNRSK